MMRDGQGDHMDEPEDAPPQDADAFDPVLASWREALPGIDVTSVSMSVSISRLAALFNRGVEEHVRPYGFGYGELEVLFYLLSGGKPYERRPSDLTKGCFVTSGAITGRVDRLERLGLVTRIPSLIDRREMVVRLTRDGEKLSRRLQLAVASDSALALALRQIEPERRASLDTELRRLLREVETLLASPDAATLGKAGRRR